jgi:hypothetical protein
MRKFQRHEETEAKKAWLTDKGEPVNNVNQFFSQGSNKVIGFFDEESQDIKIATTAGDLENNSPSNELYALDKNILESEGVLLDD